MIRLSIDQQVELMDRDEGDRFSAHWLLGDDAGRTSRDILSERYEEALSAIIEGHDDTRREEILDEAGRRGWPLLDRITAELAAHACCDPLTAVAFAVALGNDAFVDCSATDDLVMMVDAWNASDSGSTQTVVWVAPGIQWTMAGTLILDLPKMAESGSSLPEMTLVGATGRPLGSVISHPVLNRHPIAITGMEDADGGRTRLITDADRTPIPLAELATIRPPGAAVGRVA